MVKKMGATLLGIMVIYVSVALAMKAAIGISPIDAALVDHVHIPDLPSHIKQISITHGDALSVSIGAASIIAKVTRDRMMVKYAEEYPGYGFEKHKGYGTKAHYAAIEEQGISPIHRRTFLKNILEKQ